MATYTGDATIVDVLTLSGSRTTTGTTIFYTVPANHFAELQFISGASNLSVSGGTSANVFGGGISFHSATEGDGNTSNSFADSGYRSERLLLDEGNTVGISLVIFSGDSVSGTFRIIVKNKP